jgi:putative DNA primase/helicase
LPREKRPILQNWPAQATADPNVITRWWRRQPEANIGIATGAGLLVLDVDATHDGFESLALLEDTYGALPDTPAVLTGSGGRHIYFRLPEGVTVRNSAGKLGPGLDVRGDGGYVVAPPSTHPNGQRYEWLEGQSPDDLPLASAPDWLLRLITQPTTRPMVGGNGGGRIPEGQRNTYLTSFAGRLRRSGLSEDAIARALLAENAAVCDPPLAEAEVRRIAASICRYAPGFALTDMGNAERFSEAHRQRLFFCFDLGKWAAWTGKIWRLGDEVAVRQAADEAVRLIHVEAANTRDPDRRKEIARWALQSESRVRIVNMLELAKHRLAMPASELDGHPDLLPCENGVIDLKTGVLRSHDPTLRLTKMVEVVYDPSAECPAWEAFLRLITCGDTDLAHFLQVAIGYSLTGRTDEQCFFLLYGQGRNGKTTFVEAIRRLAGDYATKISVEALLAHRNGNGATPDVANLRGARFAVASEIPQQRSLNESLVKDLTGGDTLVARHLYGNPFTFVPTHKLWLFGNHKPTIRGDDLGIWRRVKMIPFKAIIPPEHQRPMSEVLAEFDQERSGILRWAVEGAIEWYRGGLPRCAAVDQATEDYRSESDLVTQFLAECCEAGVNYRVAKAELYATFKQWMAEQFGEKAPGQRWLTTRLLQRGYQLGGHSRGEVIGLQLRQTFGA